MTSDKTPDGAAVVNAIDGRAHEPTAAALGNGKTARLPELPIHLDDRQMKIYARIESGPRGAVRGPLGLLLHSPDVAEHAQALGEYMRYNSCFAPHLSELAIITVARHFDCDYEWSVHAPIAAEAGVARNVIAAIGEGREPDFIEEDQACLYRFVQRLLHNNDVEDDVFSAFRHRFGERGVVEAAAIMGYYSLLAFLLNAVRFEPSGTGLPPRPHLSEQS